MKTLTTVIVDEQTTLHISFSTSIKQLEKKGQIAHPKTFQIIHSFTHECNYNVLSTYNAF